MLRFGKGGGWQGAIDENRPDRPVFPYQRAFQCVAATLLDVDEFLAIGVGTGTALKSVLRSHPHAVSHGVEIDETVLNVALSYFDAPSYQLVDYWVGDGFAFVREHRNLHFNLIFVDAYLRNSIYQTAVTVETMEQLAAQLNPEGAIVYNLIAPSLSVSHSSFGHLIASAKEKFVSVIDFPVGVPYTEQNRLLVLSKSQTLFARLRRSISRSQDLSMFERLMWSLRLKQV